MSGLMGIVHAHGEPVDVSILEGMSDVMRHRGPDGIHFLPVESCPRGIGFGHLMLHTTPESISESLPFRDAVNGLLITADARIDNRTELLDALDLSEQQAGSNEPQGREQTLADSQLILRAYQKWGRACVDRLIGDFAFAIWDEREQILFCARDHIGCKPFYYCCANGQFTFASSAMGVSRGVPGPSPLNSARVADFLVEDMEGASKTSTFLRDVERLPPAHTLVFRAGRVVLHRYWELCAGSEIVLESEEEYLRAFTRVYTRAIQDRLRSNRPPASMLSGGLDSSTITATARDLIHDQGKPPLDSYSAVSAGNTDCAETQCIEAVVRQGGLNATCLAVEDIDTYLSELRQLLVPGEEPFDCSMVMPALIYLVARRSGASVVLDGIDGDHVLDTTDIYITRLMRQRRFLNAWREACARAVNYHRGSTCAARLWIRALWSSLRPASMPSMRGGHRVKQWLADLLERGVMSPELAAQVSLDSRYRHYLSEHSLSSLRENTELAAALLDHTNLTVGIERYERVASACGIEARHPLLDKRVLEFAVRLPWKMKARDGWSKYLLRLYAQRQLPESVAWRRGYDQLGGDFLTHWCDHLSSTDPPNCPQHNSRLSQQFRYVPASGNTEPSRTTCDESGKQYQQLRFWVLDKWLDRLDGAS